MAARLRWDGTAAATATQGPSVRKEGGREVAHVKAAPFLFSLSLSLRSDMEKQRFFLWEEANETERQRERESDPAHRGGRHGGGVPFHLLLLAPVHK